LSKASAQRDAVHRPATHLDAEVVTGRGPSARSGLQSPSAGSGTRRESAADAAFEPVRSLTHGNAGRETTVLRTLDLPGGGMVPFGGPRRQVRFSTAASG
jgi:hypothetical protein